MRTEELIIEARKEFENKIITKGQSTVYINDPMIAVFGKGVDRPLSLMVSKNIKEQIDNPESVYLITEQDDRLPSAISEACRDCIEKGMKGRLNVIEILSVDEAMTELQELIKRTVDNVCGNAVNVRFCRIYIIDDISGEKHEINKNALSAMAQEKDGECGTVVLGRRKQNGEIVSEECKIEDHAGIITLITLFFDRLVTNSGVQSMGISSLKECVGDYWMDALYKLNDTVSCGNNIEVINPDTEIENIHYLLNTSYSRKIDFSIIKKLLRTDAEIDREKSLYDNIAAIYGKSLEFCLSREKERSKACLKALKISIADKISDMKRNARGKKIDASELIMALQMTQERLSEPVIRRDIESTNDIEVQSNGKYIKEIFDNYLYPELCDIEREYKKKGCEMAIELIEAAQKEHNAHIDEILKTQKEVARICSNHRHKEDVKELCHTMMMYDRDIDTADSYLNMLLAELNRINIIDDFKRDIENDLLIYADMIKRKADPYCKINNFDIKNRNYFYIGNSEYSDMFTASGSGVSAIKCGIAFSDTMLCCYEIDAQGFANQI